jgi:hypothetical protein
MRRNIQTSSWDTENKCRILYLLRVFHCSTRNKAKNFDSWNQELDDPEKKVLQFFINKKLQGDMSLKHADHD